MGLLILEALVAQERHGYAVARWLRDHDRRRLRFHERIEHMDAILLDLRYAHRKLRQQPAFSLSVILVLALGIGAATTMFSAVNAAMLYGIPFVGAAAALVLMALLAALLPARQARLADPARTMRAE